MPRLAAILFFCGWGLGLMGAFDAINESISLVGAVILWTGAAIILIWDRVKKYQKKHLQLQSDWDEFDGQEKTEFTSLPDPAEFDLETPL
tara:strand:- start:1841 stop:2110 length:270 start_codon:yes stop_codon:yes gene_type:complete